MVDDASASPAVVALDAPPEGRPLLDGSLRNKRLALGGDPWLCDGSRAERTGCLTGASREPRPVGGFMRAEQGLKASRRRTGLGVAGVFALVAGVAGVAQAQPAGGAAEPAEGPRLDKVVPVDLAQHPLNLAAVCRLAPAAGPEADRCSEARLPAILGQRAGDHRVAYVADTDVGGCGEDDGGALVRVAKASAAQLSPKMDAKVYGACADQAANVEACIAENFKQRWQVLADLQAQGFEPAPDLRTEVYEAPAGIQSHTPSAVLGPPLAGYRLDVEGDAKRKRIKLMLSKPDGSRRWQLGTVGMHMGVSMDDAGNERKVPAEFASIGPVAVVGGDTLLVTIEVHDGGHCSSSKRHFRAAPVPAAALPKTPEAVAPKAAEPEAVAPKAAEPEAVAPKAAEPEAPAPQPVEPQPAEPEAPAPQPVAPQPAP